MALIELKNLSKTYQSSEPVKALRKVNFSIEEGELVSIVGPSGSGKSTLLNILGLLDTATKGEYIFDTYKISKTSNNEKAYLRGNKIGFIFQQFHLIPNKTVLENVALSGMYAKIPYRERLENATEAIKKVGLEDRIDFMPSNLSGGQKQRVAIARAICNNPKILLCDEPTGNLDTKTSDEICDLLFEMNRLGLTVIIVTHNDDIAARTPRTLNVIDGRVSNVS